MELFLFGWSLGVATALLHHQFVIRPKLLGVMVELRRIRDTIEPVPVRERPWEREGWCDADQRCWAWNEGSCRWWEFIDSRMISFSHDDYTHCLPCWALPVPKSEVGE
jgi:hypothetical protein